MTKFSLILTGLEESRTFIRTSTEIEEAIHGKNAFKPVKDAIRFLVFNGGEFKIPCDQDTFTKLVVYWGKKKEETLLLDELNELETSEGAEFFGGSDLSSIPEEIETEEISPLETSWSGAEDEGEDGVGQI